MERCMHCEEEFNPKTSKAMNDGHFCSRQCEFHWECEQDDNEDE